METATRPTEPLALASKLRDGIADLRETLDQAADALTIAGITTLDLEELDDELVEALAELDVFLDLAGRRDLAAYLFWRVVLLDSFDEMRATLNPALFAEVSAVHARFEGLAPDLAAEIAMQAARMQRTLVSPPLAVQDRLRSAARRVLSVMAAAGEAG